MLPRAEKIGRDPEVQEKYDALISRRHELNLQLGAVNAEREQILTSLGKLVADGAEYKKHIDRLEALRLKSELALEAGILYINNQCDLMQRFNTWLTVR